MCGISAMLRTEKQEFVVMKLENMWSVGPDTLEFIQILQINETRLTTLQLLCRIVQYNYRKAS